MFVQFITFQCVDLFRDITLHLQYCKYPLEEEYRLIIIYYVTVNVINVYTVDQYFYLILKYYISKEKFVSIPSFVKLYRKHI